MHPMQRAKSRRRTRRLTMMTRRDNAAKRCGSARNVTRRSSADVATTQPEQEAESETSERKQIVENVEENKSRENVRTRSNSRGDMRQVAEGTTWQLVRRRASSSTEALRGG